ncbi:MAG: carboxy terminal-processing peptidase [Saprospiraceae bacterium]|nr:carboxy terminal-processing peptidase [Saprospiraceae bacterium]
MIKSLRKPVIFASISAVLLGATFIPRVNEPEKEAMLIYTILNGLEQLHYQPTKIDDDFSTKVYNLYLERLDESKRFFTQQQIKQLEPFKLDIDDESNKGTFEFFNKAQDLLAESKTKTQTFYREILSQPFDFNTNEEIELAGEKRDFAKDDKELRNHWYKLLKYETLSRLVDKIEDQDKTDENLSKVDKKDPNTKPTERKSFEELEKDARQAVLKIYDDWYKRMEKQRRKDHLSMYLNTITNVFDPHSGYFDPSDKQNFDISMSGRLEGIGARLMMEGDFAKITEIVPGGPAWKQKDLKPNDLIMKVAQANAESVDCYGLNLDEVISMIRGKKNTEVTLTVKREDGTTKNITILRDEVITDEGFAKSAILDYSPALDGKIGYILLPRFYADFEQNDGRSCSKDVGKEIEKLKEQNVKGIILDLRYNGGGSLRDVVTMSGFFINKGPIVQVKSRDAAPEIHYDYDEKTQFDGPLVVLVNNSSASASEILAAALQDYGRAIIVGSNSTYGKGTVQRFFDLDRALRGNDVMKPLGELKLTVQNFYRIDGGSTQLKGVTPDIILPDNYQYIETGEKENDYPLQWSQIEPVKYNKYTNLSPKMDKIKKNSTARVSKSIIFNTINENAKRLKTLRDDTKHTLNYTKYKADQDALEVESKKYEDLFKEIPSLTVANIPSDLAVIQADSSHIARNDDWFKSIKKDIYLEEALYIIGDIIKN